MNRTGARPLGDRTISTLVHAAIDKVQDGPLQQALNLVGRGSQALSDIEHLHPFGMRTFPQDKTSDEDAKGGAPEGGPEVSILSLGGNQSNALALPAIDRRFGPMNLAKGETVLHDAFKQILHFGKDVLKGESPKGFLWQVASPKQQSGGQSGSSAQGGKSKQQNSGRADLTAEKQVHVSVEGKKDGTYTVNAEGAGTITCKTLTLKAGGCTITMADGKIILDGEVHLGGAGGQRIGMIGTKDTHGDALVSDGTATKVYAT